MLDETNPAHQVTVGGLLGHLGYVYALNGPLDEAEAFAERGLALLRPLRDELTDTFPMFMCFIALSIVAERRGLFQQAIAYIKEQEALGLVRFQGRHLNNLGIFEMKVGNYAVAQDYFRRAVEHNRQDKFLGEHIKSLDLLGDACFFAGDLKGAKHSYQEAVSLVRQHGPIGDMDDYALARLGNVVLEQGDLEKAEACARQTLAKHVRPDGFRCGALELLGRVATAKGDYGQAELWLNQAIGASLEPRGGLANLDASWDDWSVLLHVCDLWLEQGRSREAAGLLGFFAASFTRPFRQSFARAASC